MDAIDQDVFNKLKVRMKDKFPVLIDGFLRDSKLYIETIQTNIPTADISKIINAAHSLKSASGLLGFKQLHFEANRIEYIAKDLEENGEESAQNLLPTIDTLNNAYLQVVHFIKDV